MSSDGWRDPPGTYEPNVHHQHVARALGQVAHDLNNTIGAIANFADFLVDELDVSDPRHADAERIQSLARETGAYLGNLLAVAGRDFLDIRRIAVAGLLREVAMNPGVEIPVRLAVSLDDGEALVLADTGRLQDVVRSFLANAAAAGTNEVTIEVQRTGAGVPTIAISVHDRGRGLNETASDDPFAPLTRSPDGRRRWSLAKAAGFAAQMGGRISLRTQPGAGTTVTLELPLAPNDCEGAA